MVLLYERFMEREQRQEYRSAMVAWLLAEVNRDRKSKVEPYALEDFLLFSAPIRRDEGSYGSHGISEAEARGMLESYKLFEAMAQRTQQQTFLTFAETTAPETTVEHARMPWDDAIEAQGAA